MGLILKFVEWCQRPEMIKGQSFRVNRRVITGLLSIFLVSMVSIAGSGFLAQTIPAMIVPLVYSTSINSSNGTVPPSIQWMVTLGGEGTEIAADVIETTDGGYILAVDVCQAECCCGDILVIKTDSAGRQLWNITYSIPGDQMAYIVKETEDGGFIVLGGTYETENTDNGILLLRLDANGGVLWVKTYSNENSSCPDNARSFIETANGFLIVGNTYVVGDPQILLMMVDHEGNERWRSTYQISSYDVERGFLVAEEGDGNMTIVGDLKWSQGLMIRTDPSGRPLWNATVFGCGTVAAAAPAKGGGYAVLGAVYQSAQVPSIMTLTKLSPSGHEVWRHHFGNRWGVGLDSTIDGGFIIASTDDTGIWVAKVDPSGELVWEKSINGEGNWSAVIARQTNDCGYILLGNSDSSGQGDIVLAKLAPDSTLDRTPPSLLALTPLNNSVVSANDLVVCASFSDDLEVDPASIVMTVDGQDLTGSASITSSNASCAMRLEDGAHTAGIVVTDKVGNVASAEWGFTVSHSVITECLSIGGIGAALVCISLFLYMRKIAR